MKKKSLKRFKYFCTDASTSPASTNGTTLRSARLHTALATCKLALLRPPDGKMKVFSCGNCTSN